MRNKTLNRIHLLSVALLLVLPAFAAERAPFRDRVAGALYGIVIGEGMGAPQEGLAPELVQSKYLNWDYTRFIPPRQPGGAKGDGHMTDDTLMTEALMRAYGKKRDHLDAYGFRDYLVPEITETIIWLPERQQNMALIGRLNPIEKYSVMRLNDLGVWPRAAGVGGVVNCGVAMFMMPVGAVNAGDPASAYLEAASLGSAESESFGVEAAGAMAAAYAAAFAPNSTVDSVLAAVRAEIRKDTQRLLEMRASKRLNMWSLYRDNTADAIEATLAATNPNDDVQTFARKVREAYLPYETTSIEELPVALAVLSYGKGDFLRTLRAAVLYGRDNDSIAGKACGLLGAMHGTRIIPEELRKATNLSNKRDFAAQAQEFVGVIRAIHEKDQARWKVRTAAIQSE